MQKVIWIFNKIVDINNIYFLFILSSINNIVDIYNILFLISSYLYLPS